MHQAASSNMCKVMDTLVKHGASLTQVDSEGISPLHYALHGRCQEALRKLLELAADPNQVDHDTFSVLHHAANNGLLEEASILLELNADLVTADDHFVYVCIGVITFSMLLTDSHRMSRRALESILRLSGIRCDVDIDHLCAWLVGTNGQG